MKKKKWEERTVEDWQALLEQDINQWHDIRKNGCSDPFWPDGTNLNLVRNHIICDLSYIYRLSNKTRQLSLFDVVEDIRGDVPLDDPRIPPEVDNDFMVKPRAGARYLDLRK